MRSKNNSKLITEFEEIQYDTDVLKNDVLKSDAERLLFDSVLCCACDCAKFLLDLI